MISASTLAWIISAAMLFAWTAIFISLAHVRSRDGFRYWLREAGMALYFSAIAVGGVILRAMI